MTEERVARLLPEIPEGVSEIYFHPTTEGDAAELAALTSGNVRAEIDRCGFEVTSFGELAARFDTGPRIVSRRDGAPVFILGYHRSGTTILYNALVRAGSFRYPTPYHLAHFRDYREDERFDADAALAATRRRFETRGIVDRFVDGIPAHALSPEEYGFALKGGRLRPRTLDTFRDFCDFVRSGPGDGRTLLLKNPRDLTHAPFIHRSCPGAKFVFIHRYPGPTIDSRIRELRLLFSRRSPYQAEIEPGYDYIMSRKLLRGTLRLCLLPERILALGLLHGFRRQAVRLLRNLEQLPDESYTTLTYEELCADPERVVGGVLTFLGQHGCDPSVVRGMVRPVARPPARSGVLSSRAAARYLRPYLRHCGYDDLWPPR